MYKVYPISWQTHKDNPNLRGPSSHGEGHLNHSESCTPARLKVGMRWPFTGSCRINSLAGTGQPGDSTKSGFNFKSTTFYGPS